MPIKAKKTLGQHFLRSKAALSSLIEAGGIAQGDLILEIGPGEGVLTEALLTKGAKVIAVETDTRCVALLHERFEKERSAGQLTIVEGDIREERVHEHLFSRGLLAEHEYKLIANIPYYITGMLFRLFLERLRQPTKIVFLVQKEVAEEIVARDGKEGILSLAVKAYGDPRYVAKVKREAFSPPPKVDSAILEISHISRARVPQKLEESYFKIIKAGLGSRRKMLFGNLTRAFPEQKSLIAAAFDELKIDKEIRGEDLSFPQWLSLIKKLSRSQNEKDR